MLPVSLEGTARSLAMGYSISISVCLSHIFSTAEDIHHERDTKGIDALARQGLQIYQSLSGSARSRGVSRRWPYVNGRFCGPDVVFVELAWYGCLSELSTRLVDARELELALPLLLVGGGYGGILSWRGEDRGHSGSAK